MGILCKTEQAVTEHKIAIGVARFIKDKIGKGPSDVKVKITENIVICGIHGFMTKAEEMIVQSGCPEKIIGHRSLYKKQCFGEIEEIFIKALDKKVNYFFDSYIPEDDMACWTVFLD
ncbi:MAG: Na-translocating system protein MpsC family protein [Bacillota bacterium]